MMEADGYWATMDRCRAKLEGFAKLVARMGIIEERGPEIIVEASVDFAERFDAGSG